MGWVKLLGHAARPSMSRSGADVPVGSRSQNLYPTHTAVQRDPKNRFFNSIGIRRTQTGVRSELESVEFTIFQDRTIRREVGTPPETVSRQQ